MEDLRWRSVGDAREASLKQRAHQRSTEEHMNLSRSLRFRWAALAVLIALVPAPADAQGDQTGATEDWLRLYETHPNDDMPYRLMRPYAFDSENSYPVIVSLHGGGGRGTDNRKQLRVWNRLLADETLRSKHRSYVLAPQSPRLWDAEHLEKIKAVVAGLPAVDMERIYLLGHSMGGHGSFILLQIDPSYFAAAVPSAGTGRGGDPEFIDAAKIKDIPIWALHGDQDTVAPYARAQEIFADMEQVQGNMKLTTWVGDAHGVAAKMIVGGENGKTACSSDRCDPEPDVMTWLFGQSLSGSR